MREWFNVNHPFIFRRLKPLLVVTACLLLATACVPRFKYTPRHDGSYSPAAKLRGVQIERGESERAIKSEDEISWSRADSEIIARALADELKYAGLFQRVNIVKAAGPTRRPERYSHTIRFTIRKFRLGTDDNLAQRAGRAALKSRSRRGYIIDKSIPRKWVAEVEIELELREASSGARILGKKYAATRSVSTRGFSDGDDERQRLSEALEEVVKAFVADIARSAR